MHTTGRDSPSAKLPEPENNSSEGDWGSGGLSPDSTSEALAFWAVESCFPLESDAAALPEAARISSLGEGASQSPDPEPDSPENFPAASRASPGISDFFR